MSMDEGFILWNKFRRAIFDELVVGETSIQRITKKHHIILRVAEKIMNEFVEGGIVEKQENRYVFTEQGKKLMETIG